MNKYLKFEYWNTCDLGKIYYQDGMKFKFYLDADILEPYHEDVEDGQEDGDGRFIATYRRQVKRYRIRTGLLPDYLIDAIQRMKLHDNVELTFKTGEVEKIHNIEVDVEWQFERMLWQGIMNMTFDIAESVTLSACCDNLVAGDLPPVEPEIPAEWYRVDVNGVDDAGRNGSEDEPWRTLAYAASRVTTSGDVIYVNPGQYTETARITLAVGVSLTSNPNNRAEITSTYRDGVNYAIWMHSENVTDGNQYVSNIILDGSNFTAYGGIMIAKRNNVEIHHCEIRDCYLWGVRFYVNNAVGELNPIWASDNKIHHCDFYNCAGYTSSGYGDIGIDGQQRFICEYNNIYQRNTPGSNGMPIKCVPGIIRDVKIRHNNIYMNPFTDSEHWDFAIEIWDARGGVEIYDNYLEGSVDLGGRYNIRDTYAYSAHVHHNRMQQPAQALREHTRGVIIEAHEVNEYIIVEFNHIKYTATGIGMGTPSNRTTEWKNIRISYNIFESLGLSDLLTTNSKGWGIVNFDSSVNQTFDNLDIYNNVFTSKQGTYTVMWGLQVPPMPSTNIRFRNNIIVGFNYGSVTGNANNDPAITCDGLYIENNCFYNNGFSNVPRYVNGFSPTNEVTQNNITSDPAFRGASDFRLSAGSPCIGAGMNVGLTRDFNNRIVTSPPEIGAYQYV